LSIPFQSGSPLHYVIAKAVEKTFLQNEKHLLEAYFRSSVNSHNGNKSAINIRPMLKTGLILVYGLSRLWLLKAQ
jgi:hypothetical protein